MRNNKVLACVFVSLYRAGYIKKEDYISGCKISLDIHTGESCRKTTISLDITPGSGFLDALQGLECTKTLSDEQSAD